VANDSAPKNTGPTVISEKGQKIKILLADNHNMVREGIRKLIECKSDLEVVGETDNGSVVCRMAFELKPEVVVMEVRLPGLDPVKVTKSLINTETPPAVLVLTSFEDESQGLELLKAGANGCIFKTATADDLAQAIRIIRAGQFVCDPSIGKKLLKYVIQANSVVPEKGEQLSPRETELLKLAAEGCSNRDIAIHLALTEGTIKSYFVHLFNKLNVGSRTEAVMEGLKRGLVSLDEGND
jgi:DNA-binding NarL/FixJ family response regulator